MKNFRYLTIILAVYTISACSTLPDSRVEIIAHRGVPYLAPENTITSARLAWERGADAVEIDLHQTKDGQIVVIHDSSTLRVAPVNKFIRHTDYDELKQLDVGSGEHIPLLEEVLDILPPGKHLYIEIKTDSTILPELVRVIRKSGKSGNIRIISFKKTVLKQAKRLLPEVPCYLLALHIPRSGYSSLIEELGELNLDGVDLFRAAVTPELVTLLSENGFTCITWTVNGLSTARRMITAGVSGITTNTAGWFRRKM